MLVENNNAINAWWWVIMCLLFLPIYPCLRRYFHSNRQFINTVTNRRRNLHVCYWFSFFLLLDRSWSGNTADSLPSWGDFMICGSFPIYMMCFVYWNIHMQCPMEDEPFVKCYSDHVLFRLCSEHLVISQTCFWTSPKLHFVTSSAHNFYEDRIWRHSQRSEDGARK